MVEAKDLGESGTCSAPPQKDIYLHTTSRFLDTRQKHAKKHACSPIRPIENANHVRNILFARLTMKIKKFITRKQKRKARQGRRQRRCHYRHRPTVHHPCHHWRHFLPGIPARRWSKQYAARPARDGQPARSDRCR